MRITGNARRALGSLDTAVASVMLVTLVALTFGGVIMRYIVGKPLTWLEEVQLACMVWIVFAAGGAAFRSGGHVAIEILADLLPPRARRVLEVFIGLTVTAILGYLLVQSVGFTRLFLSSGRSTSMLKIPYALIYGIAPVSYAVMLISYYASKKSADDE